MSAARALQALLAALGLLAAAQVAAAAEKSVAITAIVEHPSLDQIRDGVKDELQAAGFEAGRNLRFAYQSAQGNNSTAAQIARQFAGARPDVIVAITTPSAQSVLAATRDIPVVFSGMTDPVAAKLIPVWGPSGTNVTGVSDMSPVARHLELIRRVVPTARRIGMIYNPGESNSVALIDAVKKAIGRTGMTLVAAAALRTIDVASATQSLVGKVDVLYAQTDNTLGAAFEAMVKVANHAKLPIVAAAQDLVARGAVVSLGLNYYDVGRQTGKLVVRILRGEQPGEIPPQLGAAFELHVSRANARKQGVTLPDDLVRTADRVLE